MFLLKRFQQIYKFSSQRSKIQNPAASYIITDLVLIKNSKNKRVIPHRLTGACLMEWSAKEACQSGRSSPSYPKRIAKETCHSGRSPDLSGRSTGISIYSLHRPLDGDSGIRPRQVGPSAGMTKLFQTLSYYKHIRQSALDNPHVVRTPDSDFDHSLFISRA